MCRPCILVVDDELPVIKLLRATLEPSGYETLAARDGVEALQIMEKEVFDLVILDIRLPKTDGFQVCSRLREWSQIPVIAISVVDNVMDKAKYLDLGANDYLTKPLGPEGLLARVRYDAETLYNTIPIVSIVN